MSAIESYDPNEVLREAVQSLVASHIEALLVARGLRLRKGTALGTAKEVVRGWSAPAFKFFWTMARWKDDGRAPFPSKAKVAALLEWDEKRLHDFWSKTLANSKIRAIDASGAVVEQRIFRRRKERKFSGDGIALYLRGAMAAYASVLRIEQTTGGATLALQDNLQGAIEDVEANESLTEEQRTEPRRRMQQREDAVVQGPQLTLDAVVGPRP